MLKQDGTYWDSFFFPLIGFHPPYRCLHVHSMSQACDWLDKHPFFQKQCKLVFLVAVSESFLLNFRLVNGYFSTPPGTEKIGKNTSVTHVTFDTVMLSALLPTCVNKLPSVTRGSCSRLGLQCVTCFLQWVGLQNVICFLKWVGPVKCFLGFLQWVVYLHTEDILKL